MPVALILAAALAGQTPPEPRSEIRRDVRVLAARGPEGPDGPGVHRPARDRNGDGFVTRDEFTEPQTQAFNFLDRNHDGKISAEEFAEGRAAAIAVLGGPDGPGGPGGFGGPGRSPFRVRLDGPDGDMPPPPPPPGADIRIHRIGAPGEGSGDLDRDHDGKISEEEFEAPLKEAFQRMDRNHSGFIEADENGQGGGVRVSTRNTAAPAD